MRLLPSEDAKHVLQYLHFTQQMFDCHGFLYKLIRRSILFKIFAFWRLLLAFDASLESICSASAESRCRVDL